jgi:hypothetical protein
MSKPISPIRFSDTEDEDTDQPGIALCSGRCRHDRVRAHRHVCVSSTGGSVTYRDGRIAA